MCEEHDYKNTYYCMECTSICHTYEQGLCCYCDNPWETEVVEEEDYPKKWVPCRISIILT